MWPDRSKLDMAFVFGPKWWGARGCKPWLAFFRTQMEWRDIENANAFVQRRSWDSKHDNTFVQDKSGDSKTQTQLCMYE
jgi:hypothetical protein